MKTTIPGIFSRNIEERHQAAEDLLALRAALESYSITRADVVHSMEREHNVEIYTLDHHHTAEWTPGMKVAVCRENVWGATVDGCTVRVFID